MQDDAPDGAPNQQQTGLRALGADQVFGENGRSGLSRSEGYRLMDRGEFPRGFLVTPAKRAWFEHEIDAWLLQRAQAGAVKGRAPQRKDPLPDPALKRPRGRPRKQQPAGGSIFGGRESAA